MTSYEEYFGNYLKQADIRGDMVVTIVQVKPEMVGRSKDAKEKLVCYLREFDKPLILNQGNSAAVAATLNTTQIEEWANQKITLYVDKTVKFGTETVGGIRVRVPNVGVVE